MNCPACGAEASGAFCGRCGASLHAASTCRRCGSGLTADARFCTQCGAAARRTLTAARAGLLIPVVVVALLGGYWLGGADQPAGRTPDALALSPAGSPATRTPPPLTGSPRQQADRLFERIMQARARGDREEVRFFLPMGLQAYGAVPDLDADGLFHLGLLQLESGSHADVRTTAARIEASDDGHLFAPALFAEAALAAGDTVAARAAFATFLARFDVELARGLPEYEMHRPALDEYRAQALTLTGA